MLHAKTAMADQQWARVGSSNLNIASWLSNREIDVAVEDVGFATQLAEQYERDLENATEIVLAPRRRHRGDRVQCSAARPHRPHGHTGSSSRAAASALRLANSVGAAISSHRVLGDSSLVPMAVGSTVLLALAVIGALWPAVLAWPLAALCAWFAVGLAVRGWNLHRQRRRLAARADTNIETDTNTNTGAGAGANED